MADAALRLMTLDEFLNWTPPGDRRYELYEGYPVAMAPTVEAHGVVVLNLARRISEALDRRPPCRVRVEAGLSIPQRGNSWYIPDLAVTCVPPRHGQVETVDPVLIGEVLSPTTEENDRKVKLLHYRKLASVQEIIVVDPQRVFVEIHRRLDGARWQVDYLEELSDTLVLPSCEAAIPLSQVYANVALAPDQTIG